MSTSVPALLAGLFDDAAMMPPWTGASDEAVRRHRARRTSDHADLVGPLLLPASRVADLVGRDRTPPATEVAVVADAGPAPAGLVSIDGAIRAAADGLRVRHVEIPVAMRGDDPIPGLRAMLDREAGLRAETPMTFYAEVPLTWGVLASLDLLAAARGDGARVGPKFRVGGLAAELFPTPMELAAVICACRERGLPFRLTAGRCRAVRRTDPETGLVNHGYLNILAAVVLARADEEEAQLAEVLAAMEAPTPIEVIRDELDAPRPMLRGITTTCGLDEPIEELRGLWLLR